MVCGVLVVLLLTMACGGSPERTDTGAGSTRTEPTGPPSVSFPAPDPVRLRASVDIGSLRVEASRIDRTDVEVRPSDPSRTQDVETAERTRVINNDGTIVVESPEPQPSLRNPGAIDVDVVLPEGSNVDADVSVADVDTVGRLGAVDLRSGTGVLRVDRVADLTVRTETGALICAEATRTVDVESQTGPVRIGVGNGTAARLDLSSMTGNVRVDPAVDQSSPPDVRIDVRTATGSIQIAPAG